MLIDKTEDEIKQLEEEEQEAEGEYDEDEGEGFDQYDTNPAESKLSQPGETLEERREKGLKEIFGHYARSQMLIGRKATFEQIQHEISNLNLGEYMKFWKDFEIPWNKVKIAEIFKKIATNSKELFFEEFKNTLWKLFENRNLEEIDKLKKRLREIRKINKKNNKEPEKPSERNKDLKDAKVEEHKADDKKEKEPQKKEEKDDNILEQSRVDTKQDEKKEDPSQPQQISRPKGGDPKNVETLQNLQKERSDSEGSQRKKEDIKDGKDTKDQKNVSKEKEEINKKVDVKSEDGKADKDGKKHTKEDDKQQEPELSELDLEKLRILNRIEELKAPTQEEFQEEILSFLQCDDPKAYKKKSKGFILPFNTRAKYEDTNNYKFKKKQNIEEIKKKVQKLKLARQKQKVEEEKKKKYDYTKHQNIMKRMHEDLLRDKGIYIAPGMSPYQGNTQMGISMAGSAAGQRMPGYKIPRKFTLESLNHMDYRDFIIPTGNNEDDEEFKPSDVLDSDDDDYEDFPSALPRPHISMNNSQIMPIEVHHQRQAQNPIKNHVTSVPISSGKPKKEPKHRENKSMLIPQKRQHVRTEHRYSVPNKGNPTPAKKRGHSVIHHGALTNSRVTKKSHLHLSAHKAYKSNKHSVSDYSPGRKRNAKLRMANNKSLKRANEYDLRNKKKQEQKLKNIMKMHNKKSTKMLGNKIRL